MVAAVAMKAVAVDLPTLAWIAAAELPVAAVRMPMVSLDAAAVGLTAEVPLDYR